jgi:hypothetical protein
VAAIIEQNPDLVLDQSADDYWNHYQLTFALYSVSDRAIPSAFDGLKPGQCVLGYSCCTPPLHQCDIEIGQGHLVHHPRGAGCGVECVEGGVETLLAAAVGFVIGLGGDCTDQFVEFGVGDCETKTVVVCTDSEYCSLAIGVEKREGAPVPGRRCRAVEAGFPQRTARRG